MRGYSDYNARDARPKGQTAAQIKAEAAKDSGRNPVTGLPYEGQRARETVSESRREVLRRAGL